MKFTFPAVDESLRDLLVKAQTRFFEEAPTEFLACLAAGIPVTYTTELSDGKYVISATTDKTIISKDKEGRIVSVVPSRETRC